MSKDKNKDI